MEKILGINNASPTFLKVIAAYVSLPVANREYNWNNLYVNGMKLFEYDLSVLKTKAMLPFENREHQIDIYIKKNLPNLKRLQLAAEGYPYSFDDMGFLNWTISQDNLVLPAFVLMDAFQKGEFGISLTHQHGSKDYGVTIHPYDLKETIVRWYSKAMDDMYKSSGKRSVAVSYKNTASPPDWARKEILRAQTSGLFRKVYIVVDHTQMPWDTTDSIFPKPDFITLEQQRQARLRAEEDNRRKAKASDPDPLVIGVFNYDENINGQKYFGTINSLVAVYDPSKLERYVLEKHILSE